MASQAVEFWSYLQYQSQIPSWVAALKSNTEAISLPHNLYVTVTPAKISCLAVWYCNYAKFFDNSIDDFSLSSDVHIIFWDSESQPAGTERFLSFLWVLQLQCCFQQQDLNPVLVGTQDKGNVSVALDASD